MPSPVQPSHLAWRLAAMAWLIVVLLIGWHQFLFWQHPALSTDVLALLPTNEQAPDITLATRQRVDHASSQIVVLLGTPDWPRTQRALQAWRTQLQTSQAPLIPSALPNTQSLQAAIDFYRPWRDRLLTPTQRQQLNQTPTNTLAQSALSTLYQPSAGLNPANWASDPFNLARDWWLARAGQTRARPKDNELWLSHEGREWAVLTYTITGPAFALNGQTTYANALQAAQTATQHIEPDLRVLQAGVPLHSEAAATQANFEINTIGWGSFACVLLLVWLAFGSVRPIVLVASSLLIGFACALSVTALVFKEVHLLTLIFGASLMGVAEDYGIHYFASRQGHPQCPPRTLMRQLLPGLLLALLTSVMAYAALGAAPFPGLRQMALFSAVGLLATFLTAVCWFPWLDQQTIAPNRVSNWIGASQKYLHAFAVKMSGLPLAMLTVLAIVGLFRFQTNDDIRQLQSSPPALLACEREVAQLLGSTSPGQFYLVHGTTIEEVLQHEEALKTELDAHIKMGHLSGYRALSDWVPSVKQQTQDALLTYRLESEVINQVNRSLGETQQRPTFSTPPLQLATWMAHPISASARDLWLGTVAEQLTSVVTLQGLQDPKVLPQLGQLAQHLPGIRWVDKTQEVSSLLERYRKAMTWLLLVGHGAVALLLWWRYKRAIWRAYLPTLLASLTTVALLSSLGAEFQLFHVLALTLLLGIGVDYSIFLMEHQSDPSAWLAVVIGAASTWLSLGLLGLSSTPALRSFGLTLLVGIALVWYLAALYARPYQTPYEGITK